MPSGVIHTKATVATTLVVSVSSYLFGATPETTLALSVGAFLGTVVNPDADCDNGSYSLYVVRVLCGDVVSRLYQLFWMPYSLIVKHRSFISHSPIIGTAIRFAYLFAVPAIIIFALDRYYAILLLPLSITVFCGLCVSDTVHVIMDAISTAIKRTS